MNCCQEEVRSAEKAELQLTCEPLQNYVYYCQICAAPLLVWTEITTNRRQVPRVPIKKKNDLDVWQDNSPVTACTYQRGERSSVRERGRRRGSEQLRIPGTRC